MTEEQFQAAITHYMSPMARPFEEVFVHRGVDGRETAIYVFDVLGAAEAELYKRKTEVLAFREIRQYWEKNRSIRQVAEVLDAWATCSKSSA